MIRSFLLLFVGITPACAGKTHIKAFVLPDVKDHPRVCGENGRSKTATRLLPGSPPRVRGKLQDNFTGVLERRITPACAGKTQSAERILVSVKDHPRVCGENSSQVIFST